jgi:phosphonate transport system ATP-binding protein
VSLAFDLRAATVEFDGRRALQDVDLAVEQGEAVALVGPSGAGKTTLLRLLNGTLRPSSGAVSIEGEDAAQLAPRALRALRARIGFVHQDHSLVPTLRAAQNVIAGRLGSLGMLASLRAMLWPSMLDLERAHELLERVGVGDKLFQRTDTLSGGQEQRVAIARALFQEPTALLADEPVASVDPARARDLIALLTELAAERGLALVCSLHDVTLARDFFPRVVGLRAGRVAFDAPIAALGDEDFERLYRLAERREP